MPKPTKKILHFEGLYGEPQQRISSEFVFLELIATRSQIFDWKILPHIHTNLFQLFVLENGALEFEDENELTHLTAPCVILIPPTFIHGLKYTPNCQGYILTLNESYVDDIFRTSNGIWKTLNSIRIYPQLDDDGSFKALIQMFQILEEELFNESGERELMLRAQLAQIFICLHRITNLANQYQGDTLMLTYFRKFQQAIKNSDYSTTVSEIADQLQISSVHLNRICKSVAGRSSIALHHEKLIEESKKYLLHTSYSISEIAYQMKFEYPNYFARFFKKHVGNSPMEYRKQKRKIE